MSAFFYKKFNTKPGPHGSSEKPQPGLANTVVTEWPEVNKGSVMLINNFKMFINNIITILWEEGK
jgi:hypothetical protein